VSQTYTVVTNALHQSNTLTHDRCDYNTVILNSVCMC